MEANEILRRITYECGTDGPDRQRIRGWCVDLNEALAARDRRIEEAKSRAEAADALLRDLRALDEILSPEYRDRIDAHLQARYPGSRFCEDTSWD